MARYLRWGIYTSIPTWTHSQKNLTVTVAPGFKISTHVISQMITKTVPISKIIKSCTIKRTIPFRIWRKVNRNWDNYMIEISKWTEATIGQILRSEEKNISKRAGLPDSLSGVWAGKISIWVRSFDTIIKL